MSLVQLIECTKCGHSQSIPYDPAKLPQFPWEAWPKGCPKCGSTKVDVTVIQDKSGAAKDVEMVNGGLEVKTEVVNARKLPCGCEVGTQDGWFFIKPCSPTCGTFLYVIAKTKALGKKVHYIPLKEGLL